MDCLHSCTYYLLFCDYLNSCSSIYSCSTDEAVSSYKHHVLDGPQDRTSDLSAHLDSVQTVAGLIPVILDSIVVSIPACHAGDRGSIPRRGDNIFACSMTHLHELGALISDSPNIFVSYNINPKHVASAGNRTRAARVAGEHSTTEPPMLTHQFRIRYWLHGQGN